jgi:hypothetical protein
MVLEAAQEGKELDSDCLKILTIEQLPPKGSLVERFDA